MGVKLVIVDGVETRVALHPGNIASVVGTDDDIVVTMVNGERHRFIGRLQHAHFLEVWQASLDGRAVPPEAAG